MTHRINVPYRRRDSLFVIVLMLSVCWIGAIIYGQKRAQGEQARRIIYSFDRGMDGWIAWGDGKVEHQPDIGHHKLGSIAISCLPGQIQTIHRTIEGLAPGRYKITSWIRAFEVAKGQWDIAIWLFADGGKGIISPVKDLNGTFNWRRAVYTVEVTGKQLTLWFRLRSQGILWVDYVEITPHNGPEIAFELSPPAQTMPKPQRPGSGVRCSRCYRWWQLSQAHCQVCGGRNEQLTSPRSVTHSSHKAKKANNPSTKPSSEVKLLFDFEADEEHSEQRYHSLRRFRSDKATSGRRSAVIYFGRYNNISMSDAQISDWSGYDYLAIDIYNPLSEYADFALSINDKVRAGYWDQLNHTATLAPGWNRTRFELRRYVGERGSTRIKRYIDLSRIREFWFAVAAEKRVRTDVEFLADNIRLIKRPQLPSKFKGLHLFDFVTDPQRTQRDFTAITPQHAYHADIGFGLRDAKIWRVIDSVYVDNLLRDAIMINSGEFVIDLPNGEYIVHLFAEHLGFWYEHFWTHREISVNGRVILQQRRPSATEYLRDFLRFQDVEPQPDDHPYHLYLRKLLAPITAKVQVHDRRMIVRFNGSPSAIGLNALVIYPKQQRKAGAQFMSRLWQSLRDEFDQISRKIEPIARIEPDAITKSDRQRGFYAPLISPSTYPRYNWILRSQGRKIELQGGWAQRPMQALMIRNFRSAAPLKITASALRSATGSEIAPSRISLRYGVQQFICHQLNHETYELAPRFLRPFPVKGLSLPTDHSLLVWLQIPLSKDLPAGEYRGTLQLTMHNQDITYPIKLTIYPFSLPKPDIAVGYFGLDPVGFDYFEGKGIEQWKWKWRRQVLQLLAERGFNTWSSLPNAKLQKQGQDWQIAADEIDRLMKLAQSMGFDQPVFSYGGSFPESILQLDQREDINGLSQREYRKISAHTLRQLLAQKRWLPIIHNFSDEAAGYSNTVARDMQRAEILQQHYPFLRRGGFAHSMAPNQPAYQLNLSMTDISLSSYSRSHIREIQKRGLRWGIYNAAIGPFDVGRATFGEGLFVARLHGATHRLEWYLTLAQNYPYYDFDGREYDAMMLYPRTDGRIDLALKFEWAAMGLEDYRLLLLLEQLAQRQSNTHAQKARQWLKKYHNAAFFSSPNYLQLAEKLRTDESSAAFRRDIYRLILSLSNKSTDTKLPKSD